MALARRGPAPGLIWDSDQGSQFVSLAFGDQVRAAGIAQSMGSRGDCYDNAVAESFFATLKKELVHRRSWPEKAELRNGTLTSSRCRTDAGVLRGYWPALATVEDQASASARSAPASLLHRWKGSSAAVAIAFHASEQRASRSRRPTPRYRLAQDAALQVFALSGGAASCASHAGSIAARWQTRRTCTNA